MGGPVAMTLTTIEAHLLILTTCLVNIATTVVGLLSLRKKLNGHLKEHKKNAVQGGTRR